MARAGRWYPNRPTTFIPKFPSFPAALEHQAAVMTASRSPSVTFSTPTLAGDLVVMWPSSTTVGQTITEPSGWSNPLGAGVDVESDSHQICCVYHLVTSAEAGTQTWTVTNLYGVASTGAVQAVLVRYVDTATPVPASGSTFSSVNTATPHVLAGVTDPNTTDGLYLSSVAADATDTYTTPTTWFQLGTFNTNNGRWLGGALGLSVDNVALGATNITPATGDEYASITVVVKFGMPPAPKVIAISPATETDLALGIGKQIRTAVETDTALSIVRAAVAAYPRRIQGRKIVDQYGRPFLLPTMASWSMASNLSNADITTALEGVASNGFKGVTVWIGGGYHLDGTWHAYTNKAGSAFWTGTPWASTLGAAWSSVDWIVTETQRLGLVLSASLCGANGTTGARPDWEAVTNSDMTAAGTAVANRYPAATYPHVIWHVMVDDSHTPGTTAGARIEAYFAGVNSVEGSVRPVRWMEQNNGSTTNGQGWLNSAEFAVPINTMYDYSNDSAVNVETVYAEVVTAPIGDCEPKYVGNTISRQDLRERTYADFFEGGNIINFGHEDWWPFGSTGLFTDGETWPTVQAATPLLHQRYANALIDLYVKDLSWVPEAGVFVTTGQGAGDTKAAAGFSNTAALAYFPDSRTIVVNTAILSAATVRLRWFDPTNNTYTSIAASEAPNTGRSVTHPGNSSNSAGDSDWILVVDLVDAGSEAAQVTVRPPWSVVRSAGW